MFKSKKVLFIFALFLSAICFTATTNAVSASTDFDVFLECWLKDVADAPECAASDFDEDGGVGVLDFNFFKDAIATYDLNGDGMVNAEPGASSDYDVFQECWHKDTTETPDCAKADFDNNDYVEANDYTLFGEIFTTYDLNGDGVVNTSADEIKPDLTVENIYFNASVKGEKDYLSVVVKNLGGNLSENKGLLNWSHNFGDHHFTYTTPSGDDDSVISYETDRPLPNADNPLETNETITFSWFGYFDNSGNLSIEYTVDSTNQLSESNEDNNSLTRTITISNNNISISNILVSNIKSTEATIGWTTDESVSSRIWVWEGRDKAPGDDPAFMRTMNAGTNQSITAKNLKPSTLYTYQITALQNGLTVAESTVKEFITANDDSGSSGVTDLKAENITSTSALIAWKTAYLSDNIVYWTKSGSSDFMGAGNGESSLSHSVQLHSLSPFTTYNFYVKGKNADGSSVKSGVEKFTTQSSEVEVSHCTDSDGGKNYFVKGKSSSTVVVNNNTTGAIDACSDDTLYEAVCGADGIAQQVAYKCKHGCSYGACIRVKDDHLKRIRDHAKNLFNNKFDQLLNELKELRDIVREQQTQIKYLVSLKKDMKQLSETVESAINNFITYGVDDNTKRLGAGERAAVMHSFKSAFKKLPETEDELADAIKIANGRWPSARSDEAEKTAKKRFEKIYKKIANMDNPNDNAAITVMAYGLRQKAENRNLDSERTGIKTFQHIYGYHPASTEDWNIMQAITYSGASRGADSDGDLLLDEREVELGTDPNNPDTDGDGFLDGEEVANGFDPLKK